MGCLLSRRRQLVEMLTSEHNRLLQADEDVSQNIQAHIIWLEKALLKLNEDVDNRIKRSPAWHEKDTLLKSVPGVGKNNLIHPFD
jgi:transposase